MRDTPQNQEAGFDPAPERSATTWASFLQSQAEALLACDFFESVTLSGTRVYVLAAQGHVAASHRPSSAELVMGSFPV